MQQPTGAIWERSQNELLRIATVMWMSVHEEPESILPNCSHHTVATIVKDFKRRFEFGTYGQNDEAALLRLLHGNYTPNKVVEILFPDQEESEEEADELFSDDMDDVCEECGHPSHEDGECDLVCGECLEDNMETCDDCGHMTCICDVETPYDFTEDILDLEDEDSPELEEPVYETRGMSHYMMHRLMRGRGLREPSGAEFKSYPDNHDHLIDPNITGAPIKLVSINPGPPQESAPPEKRPPLAITPTMFARPTRTSMHRPTHAPMFATDGSSGETKTSARAAPPPREPHHCRTWDEYKRRVEVGWTQKYNYYSPGVRKLAGTGLHPMEILPPRATKMTALRPENLRMVMRPALSV